MIVRCELLLQLPLAMMVACFLHGLPRKLGLMRASEALQALLQLLALVLVALP